MTREPESFEVRGPDGGSDQWWIVHIFYKGAVLNREQLIPGYDTQEAAEAAAADMQKSLRG